VAAKIVEECRGDHDEYVFVWRRERVKNVDDTPTMPYRPIHTMNNTAFQNGRPAAKLEKVRVHDLRHTFGQRLRDAGVSEEDRALLRGYAITGMPQHYATATSARPASSCTSAASTRAPSSMNSSTVARPMADAAPVMTATFPLRRSDTRCPPSSEMASASRGALQTATNTDVVQPG